MLKIKLIVLTLFLATGTFARVGIADWTARTPGGNEINNFSDITIYLKNGQELRWVAEWYFYKGFVVGRLGNKNRYGDTIGYFTVNEYSCKIDTFKTESSWINYIDQNKLKPKLWIRWFNNDWTVINERLIYVFIFAFFITIPVVILFWVILLRAIKREGFNMKKPYSIAVMVIFALIFFRWILDSFPQSL